MAVRTRGDELVSGAEIGRRLNLSRERISKIARTPKLEFPKPVTEIGRTKVWRWPEVERWAKKTGRL